MKSLLLSLFSSGILFQTLATGMAIPTSVMIKCESDVTTYHDFLEMSMTAGWYDLPPFFYGSVYAMSVYDGSLYVAGDFFDAAGIPDADNIARWDGCLWYAVAPGITGPIYEMAIIDGDIYVGGSFSDAGGNPNADNIAVLNASQWNPIGTGLNGPVFAIAGNGNDVYVGGSFTDAGGNPDADRIAKWNGSSWNALGTGLNDVIYTIVIQGSQVFAGGNFTNAGGNSAANYIAKWENNSWHALGDGLNDWVWNMAVHDSDLYVIGAFYQAGGNFVSEIAKWDGVNWQNLGDYFQQEFNYDIIINTITVVDDLIYVGVTMDNCIECPDPAWILEWNIQNSVWSGYPPGYPDDAPIGSIAVDDNYIYVGNIVDFGGGGGGGCGVGFTSHHSSSRGSGGILRWGEPPPEIFITNVPESLCEYDPPISLPTIQSGFPGNWSGPGVINNTFDPEGLNEGIQLTFTPLQSPCPEPVIFEIQIIHNIISLNVPTEICESGIPLELNNEQSGITGNWSGPGIANNVFDPAGLNGIITISFTPDPGQCASPAETFITVKTCSNLPCPVGSDTTFTICPHWSGSGGGPNLIDLLYYDLGLPLDGIWEPQLQCGDNWYSWCTDSASVYIYPHLYPGCNVVFDTVHFDALWNPCGWVAEDLCFSDSTFYFTIPAYPGSSGDPMYTLRVEIWAQEYDIHNLSMDSSYTLSIHSDLNPGYALIYAFRNEYPGCWWDLTIIGCDYYWSIPDCSCADPPYAGENNSINICDDADPFDLTTSLGGNPDGGGYWTPAFNSGGNIYDPVLDGAGIFTYTVIGTSGCPNDDASITIQYVDLNASIINETCFDNNTPSDNSDDIIQIQFTPLGYHTGTNYSVFVSSGSIGPSTGNYNSTTNFQMQPGSAGGGNVTLTVRDNADPFCSFEFVIEDPGSCSMNLDCPTGHDTTIVICANSTDFQLLIYLLDIQGYATQWIGFSPGGYNPCIDGHGPFYVGYTPLYPPGCPLVYDTFFIEWDSEPLCDWVLEDLCLTFTTDLDSFFVSFTIPAYSGSEPPFTYQLVIESYDTIPGVFYSDSTYTFVEYDGGTVDWQQSNGCAEWIVSIAAIISGEECPWGFGGVTFATNFSNYYGIGGNGCCACSDPPFAGEDNYIDICIDTDPFDLTYSLGGDPGGTWTPPLNSGGNIYDPQLDAPGTYTYTVSATDCPNDVASVVVNHIDLLQSMMQIRCFDNNTPSDETDDIILIDFTPLGYYIGTNYLVSVSSGSILPGSGAYNGTTTFQMQPGSAGNGNIILTITDNTSPFCSFEFLIEDPGTCETINYSCEIPGYTFGGNYEGHSYYVSDDNATWNEAKALAISIGGHLATISNAGENSFVAGVAALSVDPLESCNECPFDLGVWIGLTDEVVEGTFVWVTGEPLIFTNWYPLMPDNDGGIEHYTEILTIDPSFGNWNDLSAYWELEYVVEFDTVTCECNDPLYAGDNNSITVCNDTSPFDLTEELGGNPDPGGTWSPTLASGGNIYDPAIDGPGSFTYSVSASGCPSDAASVMVTVLVPTVPIISGVPPSICETNSSITLPTIQDNITGNWSGIGVTNNNFNPAGLNGMYTLTFMPLLGQCALLATADILVEPLINISITGIPDSLCQINLPIPLPSMQSGINGDWSGPGVSNNTFNPAGLNGNILLSFTPDAGVCALPANTSISVFQHTYTISGIPQSVCMTDPPIQLPPVQNGITGNWSGPGVSNNTFNPSGQNGIVTLIFTPDAGQCATTQSQNIIVNALVIPSITGIPNSLCENSFPIPLLPVQNNINGSWSGQGVNSNTFNPDGLSGNIILTFDPDAGQCALSNTTIIQVNTPLIPMISGVPAIVCESDLVQDLPTTQNGIDGNWSGTGVFNNTFNSAGQSGMITLTFTPEDGQCALTNEWDIIIEIPFTPIISDLPSAICQTDLPISLPAIQNGYSGTWSGTSIINNTFNPNGLSGPLTLFFNPDNGQCASVAEVDINVETAIIPFLSGIPNTFCGIDNSFNLPTIQDGIVGNWSGPGVTNNVFNPVGQNGNITLSFIPENGQCATVATTVISVSTAIAPIISGIPSSLCQSDSTLILTPLQNGITGNWSGQNITSNAFEPNGLDGNYVLTFTPDAGQCAIPATNQIIVNVSPHFINLYTECDTISQTYHVAFDIIGGDPASYTIDGYPIAGSAFVSSPFLADSTHYVFRLDDGNGCGPVLIEGSVNCACATYAGTINYTGTTLKICEGNNFLVPFNGDAKLDADDLSAFVLHDNAGTLLGTIYAISNSTTFTFPSGIVLGQVYFISSVAGSNDGHGSIDLNDPCLSVSQGMPVIFYHPQVTISSGGIICADECMTYTFQLSGEKPFELAFKVFANGIQTDLLLITDTNSVALVICPQDFGITDGVIDIIPSSLTDANCTVGLTSFTGLQTIVRPASTAFISETLCQGESLTVNGTMYDQFNPSGTQTLQNAEGCDSTISIQLAFYAEAINEINQTLCYGGSLIVNNTEYNESHSQGTEILPWKSINGCDSIIEIDLEFDSVVMSNLYTTLCSGESIEINGNTYDETHPEGTETFPGGSILGCDSLVNIRLTFYPPSLSSVNPILCRGDTVIINGTVYDANHTTGNEIIKNGSVFGCDSAILVTVTFIPDVYEFIMDTLDVGEFIVVNGKIYDQSHSQGIEIIVNGSITGCDSTIEIVLYFRKALSVLTEAFAPICHGESTGEIVVKEINGGTPTYEVSIDGGSQMTISILPVVFSGLLPGNHQIIFTDATSNQLPIEVEVPDSPVLEVDAGMDLSIKNGEGALLIAKASFQVVTWLWTPADFLSCVDCPDPLIEKPDHDMTYTIIVTDQNGCQASDEVVLTIRYEDELYVPTVFSPNGDGVNDTWRIYSSDHQAQLISLSILDRWGGIIFHCSDRLLSDSGMEWDGSMKGNEMVAGVYVFVAVVENGDGKIIRLKGDITLIK